MQILKSKSLLLILIVAAVLRLWGLSDNPPHLTNDEAAFGYNAYSLLKTGRDIHGEFLPFVFKSFGDWRPGLYFYLDVPFIATLGLNELAVRLPAAFSGVFAVWLIYLVVGELFRDKKPETGDSKPRPRQAKRGGLATIASVLLAISPWHLQFSRGAWEANVALTFTLAGIYFFLRAVKDKKGWLVWSAVFFAVTLLTYQGAKLASTIVVSGLALVYRKEILSFPKGVLLKSVVLGFLICLPILLSLFQGKAERLEVYSIFSYERPEETVVQLLEQEGVTRGSWQYNLYHSEPLNFVRAILGRWFNHYSARFLFFEGDWSNPRHGVPNAGVILLADAALLITGLVVLARLRSKKYAMFLWYLFLFSPLPAALSRDSIHAVRSFNMVVPLTIILALGVNHLWSNRKMFGRWLLPAAAFGFLYLVNYSYYLDQYWVHAPKQNALSWQYGYKQIVEKVTPLQSKYQEIIIKQEYAQPYIFFLFYQKYDPVKYQRIAKEVYIPNPYGDVGLVSRLDNISFRDINWPADRGTSGRLFIVDPIRVPIEDSSDPKEFKVIDEIKFLNGQTAFRFIEILEK